MRSYGMAVDNREGRFPVEPIDEGELSCIAPDCFAFVVRRMLSAKGCYNNTLPVNNEALRCKSGCASHQRCKLNFR